MGLGLHYGVSSCGQTRFYDAEEVRRAVHDLVSESVQASVMTQATIAAFQRDSLAPGGRVAGLAVPPPGRRRPEHLGRGFDLPSAETSTAFVERDDSRMVCDDLRSLLSFHTCGGQVASLLILLVPVTTCTGSAPNFVGLRQLQAGESLAWQSRH